MIVDEPPLGQVLADSERQAFDVDTETEPDAESALDAIAVSVGVTRGRNGDDGGSREPRMADVALFIRRDVPAIGAFHLDLDQLKAVPTGSSSRETKRAAASTSTGVHNDSPICWAHRWGTFLATTQA